ncbi:MAG: UPF0182 family protein [Candidatus Syntrophonatronum acetioxidans]|uniref:UPF0182 protein D5R97_04615 n=1 Tax=Candidatus Syntrophonatronum acetioxidans TaxID=1795816 RepID=A0A424YF54_9FIRM|nr:MAG: UPF0182 family protein [Candidatus Syntrophonatronum acetioxidans]
MRKNFSLLFFIAVAAILVLLRVGSDFYLDFLWFDNLDLGGVFWTRYLSSWGLRLGSLVFFFAFLFTNLLFTRKRVLEMQNLDLRARLIHRGFYKYVTPRGITLLYCLGSLLIAFILTSYTGGYWMEMQQYFNATPFGLTDPIFNTEVSFYVFNLPFLRFIYQFLMMVSIVTLLLVGAIYLGFNPSPQVGRKQLLFSFPGLGHVSILLSLVFFLKAWDYRMQIWELLLSSRGYSFGAGYTDIMVSQRVLWVLFFLALILSLLFLANYFLKRPRVLVYGTGLLIGVSLIGGALLPGLVQSFLVSPSELSYERPYIEHNISFTRKAFGLDRFQVEEHTAIQELYWEDIEQTPGTFNNVRLWDYRPIGNTFRELQGLRPYYTFHDVDTDRYHVGEDYRQVMISGRELDQGALDERARTWTNLKLQFTHGYGAVMSPVNEVTADGLPTYFLEDIPPRGEEEVELNRPEIYYGELTRDYVISNTNLKEFNYPLGEDNVYTHYEGEGGVRLNSLLRRGLFALRFADYRVLLSAEINPESRFMFYRQVQERINKAAPFLQLDEDPYIVVNDGRLFWIQDAYTVNDRFPYAEPQGGVNYIRNSVKVVLDAYHGTMDFYVVEPEDPLVQTYRRIFPELFSDMEKMPSGLREHLRYPEGFFALQADMYRLYHVTNTTIFYNREDLWELPMERYAGEEQLMEPYYVILQLPGKEEEEFVLIQPYTPVRRNNMISWLAARCDQEHYGEVKVYMFPKDRVILGPLQIENRIDQSTEISEQFALWDQRGSRVIRGNLLVLPVHESVLYVEPIFLEAERGGLPELSRVIVAFGESVVMERTLEEGLLKLLGERVDLPEEITEEIPLEDLEDFMPGRIRELIDELGGVFEEAQESLRQGDWAGYGDKMEEMEDLIKDLEDRTR